MHTVVCLEWEESEAGWGVRPDGASFHLNIRDQKAYVQAYWEREKRRNAGKGVPHEYERPSGEPFLVEVDQALFDTIQKSTQGIRLWHSDYQGLGKRIRRP